MQFFFKITFFKKILSGLPPVSNSLDPVMSGILSGLIWVQTVCKGYQQMTQVGRVILLMTSDYLVTSLLWCLKPNV